ncbi:MULTISPECIES: HAD-IC family P-type ATPase [unclassified Bradyrhizobium]|uniref:HAD-IC family P-type ATPase n=1 Tax=unclassified Bradyrhizobium TaxID=2631580 RepID=UPI002916EACB|nr:MULTISPECIES: HAD-IC family P-type ATPase [unclassified Bradyrhizobium]
MDDFEIPAAPLPANAPAPATADQASVWDRGLTAAEAARRLREFGSNATTSTERPLWHVLLGKFVAPVPCLLEAAILLQLSLGEYFEAGIIGLLLVFNALLGTFQEGRAKATLQALKQRLALNAAVLRDGIWTIIPAAELVPGDIIKLTLGAVVPADVRLGSGAVMLDQSMLTGESLPIEVGPGSETFAGALIRRGEAMAEVLATGAHTRFGRTAELIRTAHVTSSQQKAVLRVVLALATINGTLALALIAYAISRHLPMTEIVPLGLIAVLASVPVALPAAFTLAAAVAAQALGRRGVLPTRLSAVDEAATMNVLCVDKTGTLTQNELRVAATVPFGNASARDVLVWARLSSSDGGLDPVDGAVRMASGNGRLDGLRRETFIPFDPATKMAEATVITADDTRRRVVKGAFAAVLAMSTAPNEARAEASRLEAEGYRVLGVSVSAADSDVMHIVGLIALSDPPRPEAADCLAKLQAMGVRVVMVTGDAPATASAVAKAIGLDGKVFPPGPIPERIDATDYAVFAGVLPEDKFALVKALQRSGYSVGMCGDGANDAPALRQAQLGIAVSTSTDVAKSAAGLVLTEPGLTSILTAVTQGRVAFQRILTYALRSIVHKVRQVSYLGIGFLIVGHAILTPTLIVISMITGDFLAMSAATDNVRPSAEPNAWRIGDLTLAGVIMGMVDLAFCVGVLLIGRDLLRLDLETLRTMTLVNLTFSGQSIYYVVRERRRLWSSRPSRTVVVSSITDILIVTALAATGSLMAPLALPIIAGLLAVAVVFAFLLDGAKAVIFRQLRMD